MMKRDYSAGESYFPETLKDSRFYEPTDNGIESGIKERLKELRFRTREAHGSGIHNTAVSGWPSIEYNSLNSLSHWLIFRINWE